MFGLWTKDSNLNTQNIAKMTKLYHVIRVHVHNRVLHFEDMKVSHGRYTSVTVFAFTFTVTNLHTSEHLQEIDRYLRSTQLNLNIFTKRIIGFIYNKKRC